MTSAISVVESQDLISIAYGAKCMAYDGPLPYDGNGVGNIDEGDETGINIDEGDETGIINIDEGDETSINIDVGDEI
eukprot:Pgem_evm1s18918